MAADQIAGIIDPYWTPAAPEVSTAAHWIIAGLYSGQIFGDFAGYSLMAMGIAKLLGYELPENFNAPYSATSFRDFWHRWHITLSAFLRDYLYIFALGGNRRGKTRGIANLGITMLLGGLWHGAAWHFVLWGAIHGAALTVERLVGNFGERFVKPSVYRLTWWIVVQATVIVAWVVFRSPDVRFASGFLAQMVPLQSDALTPPELIYALPLLLPYTVHQVARRFDIMNRMSFAFTPVSFALKSILLGTLAVFALMMWGTTRGFIYFQF